MNDDDDQIRDETDPREPYEAPAMQSEELFEQLALACGKIVPAGQRDCRRQNRAS